MSSSIFFKSVTEIRESSTTPLTERESEILSCLTKGRANKEIAAHMNISVPTVRTHLRHIYEKLAVHSRAEAIVKYFTETRPLGVP